MRVLVAAGLDPSGGAGLLADVEAVEAAGGRAWAVATALTAQGPGGARAFEPVPARFVAAQLDALLRGRERPASAKTGMVGSAENAAALARALGRRGLSRVPLVVDPVLSASSGLPLLRGARPREALWPLLCRADLLTPNWPELEALAGKPFADEAAALAAARELPCRAILVKGGHRRGPPVDLLVRGGRIDRFAGRRRPGTARGTGCRLASAIAAFLARGLALEEAIRRAKRYVERYIEGEAKR